MTDFADINTKNDDLVKRNPELAAYLGQGIRAKKPSKWHNIKENDPDGEVYDSGREASDAAKFKALVRSGEYLLYVHHMVVPLPGGVKIELDHFLLNRKLQPEVFDTKLFDEKTGKFICTPDWNNKRKQFEDLYGIKIKLI
jgi:hypothetical protein